MNQHPIRSARRGAPAPGPVALVCTTACAIACALAAPAVQAGCGLVDPSRLDAPPLLQDDATPETSFRAGLVRTGYRPDAMPMLRRVGDRDGPDFHDGPEGRAGIVGTWRFTYVSDGSAYPAVIPYGVVVDFGTAQWHADGTEFTISGARPPSSGDVCMGSWEQTGPRSYKLKHIALGWASQDSLPPASPPVFVGPAIIRQSVTLNRARTAFEGTFTIDQYAKDEVTLLQHIGGKIAATRFSVD